MVTIESHSIRKDVFAKYSGRVKHRTSSRVLSFVYIGFLGINRKSPLTQRQHFPIFEARSLLLPICGSSVFLRVSESNSDKNRNGDGFTDEILPRNVHFVGVLEVKTYHVSIKIINGLPN